MTTTSERSDKFISEARLAAPARLPWLRATFEAATAVGAHMEMEVAREEWGFKAKTGVP